MAFLKYEFFSSKRDRKKKKKDFRFGNPLFYVFEFDSSLIPPIPFSREIRQAVKETLSGQLQFQDGDRADRSLLANFQILNLVPEKFNINFNNDINMIEDAVLYWRQVGKVIGRSAHLDTIVWPGGDLVASALSARTRSVFRIVTALAPPFVMEGALDEDGQCLRGVICHRVLNSDKDNLTLVFNEMDTQERLEDEVEELGN